MVEVDEDFDPFQHSEHVFCRRGSRCGYSQLRKEFILVYDSYQPYWFSLHCQEHKREMAILKKVNMLKK